MASPISENMVKGTIGELIVQTRLLQYGVQAAAPIKDSGNDLIALKGYAVKTIQVKTCTYSARSSRKVSFSGTRQAARTRQ